jgi:hypothetical protein
MRKLLLTAVVAGMLAPAVAMAAGQNMAGCGLGSLAFKENGKWQQVLAATTNGTFGTQTFGISTGTSNCTADGAVKSERATEVFVAVNFDSLKSEMARGSGEHLVALSSLMGCERSGDLARTLQANYENTFSKAETPEALLSALNATVPNVCSL